MIISQLDQTWACRWACSAC